MRVAVRELWDGDDRTPNDLCRIAVRNLERTGVPRSAAMKMVGHKTGAISRRGLIVDEALLGRAWRGWRGQSKFRRRVVEPRCPTGRGGAELGDAADLKEQTQESQ